MKDIQSDQNATYKDWKRLLQKKGREKLSQYLIEGPHLLEEALKTDQVVAVILDETTESPYAETRDKPPLFRLSKELFRSLSETETPQGVLAVIQFKKIELDWSKGRFLLIDAVQDPGNLGTMIRTADAAGFDAIVLGKGTVDPFNPKTLRSAQGSHFHQPIIQESLEETVNRLKSHKIPILGTSLEGTSILETSVPQSQNVALIMGNEGAGVREALLSEVETLVKIPLYGQAESLNVAVATGILAYWLRGI